MVIFGKLRYALSQGRGSWRSAAYAIALWALLWPTLGLADSKAELAHQRQSQLRQQLQRLAAEHARSSDAYSHEQEQLQRLLGKQARARRSLQSTRQELEQTKKRLEELGQQQRTLQQTQRSTVQRLRRISTLFQVAQQHQDPATDTLEHARQQAWLQHLGRSRAQLLQQLDREAAQLAALQITVDEALAQQQAQQAKREEQLASLDGLAAEHSAMIRDLERQLARDERQQDALQEQLAAVDALLQRLEQARTWAGKQPKGLAPSRGQLLFPVQGQVRRAYGERTGSGQRSRGLLIDLPGGQPVGAIAPGVVVWVGWLSRLGLTMIVDHGADYFSIYAHAQQALFGVGDAVGTGEPVILSGQTGGLTQPGLYLEIRRGRRAMNPKDWFRNPPS